MTINAMAMGPKGQIIDPYGGQVDLSKRCLRHVSEAFREDPLRLLRTARFCARYSHLGFTIAPNTMALMRDIVVDGELDFLVPERIWKEVSRALMEASPQAFFTALKACGALKVIFPELATKGDEHLNRIDQCLQRSVDKQATLTQRFALLTTSMNAAELESLTERVMATKACKELAILAINGTRWMQACHGEVDTLLTLIKQADGLRRPQRFDQLLEVLGLRKEITKQEKKMLSGARDALGAMDIQCVIAGITDKSKIVEAIETARRKTLSDFFKNNLQDTSREP